MLRRRDPALGLRGAPPA